MPQAPGNPKPFTEYTAEDWRVYNTWAAAQLREDADKAEREGSQPKHVIAEWRASADRHERDAQS